MSTQVVCMQRKGGEIVEGENAIYIGRRMTLGGWDLPESPFANPFKGPRGLETYFEWAMKPEQKEFRDRVRRELTGKTLGCWCIGKKGKVSCHGEVLAYICDGIMLPDLARVLQESKEQLSKTQEVKDPSSLSPLENRIAGAFAGFFLGDALGAPHERSSGNPFDPEFKKPHVHMGRYGKKTVFARGQVTDDSEMMIATTSHLIENKGYDPKKAVMKYMEWANSGSPHMGKNTRLLLKGVKTLRGFEGRYQKEFGIRPFSRGELGELEKEPLSNGSLMRSWPLSVLPLKEGAYIDDVRLTNPHQVVESITHDYLSAMRMAFEGKSAKEIWDYLVDVPKNTPKEHRAVVDDILKGKRRKLTDVWKGDKLVEGKGSVLSSYYAFLYALGMYLKGKTFMEIMREITTGFKNSDADTNSAISAAPLGAIIGYRDLIKDEVVSKALEIIMDTSQPSEAPRPLIYHPSRIFELTKGLSKLYR